MSSQSPRDPKTVELRPGSTSISIYMGLPMGDQDSRWKRASRAASSWRETLT